MHKVEQSMVREAIRINQLEKSYPGTKAVNNLSMVVQHGTIHGFLGPNGAGKSTTMKILAGLLKKDAGEVLYYQKPIHEIRENLFELIGFLPENPPLYEYMRVREFLEFTYDIYSTQNRSKKYMVDLAIERCGLKEVSKKYITQLSKGYRQRTGLAMSMVHGPSILILDEPFVGLDPMALAELRKVLLQLKEDHTILFSSHQLDEVERLCQNLTVVKDGQATFHGSLTDFRNSTNDTVIIKYQLLNWKKELESVIRDTYSDISIQSIHSVGNETEILFRLKDLALRSELSQFFATHMIPILHIDTASKNMEQGYESFIRGHQTMNEKESEKKW